MNNLLERAINLVKVTNDNVIVVNEKNKESYVVMDLEKYERLILKNKDINNKKSLTEEELIDKINRDIVCSQKEQKNEVLERNEVIKKIKELPKLEESFSDNDEFDAEETGEENMYYYNEDNNIINDNTFSFKSSFIDDEDKSNGWKIPTEIKKKAEGIE